MEKVSIKRLSIVVSVYNEEAVLDKFYNAVTPVLEQTNVDYEILFVNDGSKDMSSSILERLAMNDARIKIITFSRNYGHEAAMLAGIDYCSGDGIICMDADLQHPVECIPVILEKFRQGYEVITMIRTQNKSAGALKSFSSSLFYKILNKISEVKFDDNASDFFAFTKAPAAVLKKHFRESSRFLRAYVQDIGFNKTSIEYSANDRAGGVSKYSFRKLFRFSVQALLSFSNLPLRIASVCGLLGTFICVILTVYSLFMKFSQGAPSGYTTIIVLICTLFTILFFLLGIIGEYMALILTETRKRPIYIVKDSVNLDNEKENL